jgi:hypothetical protein
MLRRTMRKGLNGFGTVIAGPRDGVLQQCARHASAAVFFAHQEATDAVNTAAISVETR